jgi:hypothetical protein
MILLSTQILSRFTGFFRDSIGNLAHVLSTNLTVGICPTKCFYGGYRNGFKP